ncbi:hypothetical protein PFISCL1PPCAC_6909, partial [Pristionchus fissidentatus]
KKYLEFLRLYLITKVESIARSADSKGEVTTVSFIVEYHGVGLPSDKQKITVGESFTFKKIRIVPGLNPDADLPHFLKFSHSVCLEVGRSAIYSRNTIQVPVTIVTSFVEIAPTKSMQIPKEDLLIDLSSSASIPILSSLHILIFSL